jgi:glycosyltransferase involved in cell wall biosynthesis
MRIAVCVPQVPFARGGAEILVDSLVEQLRRRGHESATVTVPFKWHPGTRVLTNALVWRMLDLDEAEGRPVDLVIATKFPSYAIRHPTKVVWLVHQFRQAYELDGTAFGQFGPAAADRGLRRAIHRLDRIALGEARQLFAISQNVADRLSRSLGLEAETLPPPPPGLEYRCEAYGDFVLSVGRLDRAKRVDLLLEAAAATDSMQLVVVGDGPGRERLEWLARSLSLNGRVTFAGRVDDGELAALYARCLAVFYAPVDEDFGFVPYEAFLSEKPVVTTHDAGGPLEVVADGETGVVVEPDARAVGEALAWLAAHPDEARARGRSGKAVAERVTWDATIDRLLGA